MKRSFLLIALLFLACGKTVDIDQRTRIDSHCECTYKISTEVWVERYWGLDIVNLEYYEVRRNIPKNDLEAVRRTEYEKAQIVAEKVKNCLREQGGKP